MMIFLIDIRISLMKIKIDYLIQMQKSILKLIHSKLKSNYLLFEEKENKEYNHLGIATDLSTNTQYIETFFHQNTDMYIKGQEVVKVKSFTLYSSDNQIIVTDTF